MMRRNSPPSGWTRRHAAAAVLLIRRDVATVELPRCCAHNTGVIVYSPMASGLLTGAFTVERAKSLPKDDWRSSSAHFTGDVLVRNLKVAALCSRSRRDTVIVRRERGARMDLGMAGCNRRHRRRTKPGAGRRMVRVAALRLTPEDLQEIAAAIAATGAGSGPAHPQR